MPVHRAERLLRASAVLVACLAVASCATMSESECLYADWYAIGLEDGAKGRHVSHVGKRRKACADAGVMPDMRDACPNVAGRTSSSLCTAS